MSNKIDKGCLCVNMAQQDRDIIMLKGVPVSVKHNCFGTRMLTLVMRSVHSPAGAGIPEELFPHYIKRGVFAATSTYSDGPNTANILSAAALIDSYIQVDAGNLARGGDTFYPSISVHGFFEGNVFIITRVEVGEFVVELLPEGPKCEV